MPDTGIRLQLLIGATVPTPAPQIVVDSLSNLEVQNHDDSRDGFQLTLTMGRGLRANDFDLLTEQYFDPGSRVIVVVILKGQPQVLIDGIVTHHQISPSLQPGGTRLIVTGEDVSLKMDLEEKRVTYPNQSDSTIVTRLLGSYGQFGLIPNVTATDDVPSSSQRTPAQDGTDLQYIKQLAQRNSFIFYVEPTNTPGVNNAYWGPDKRDGEVQPALSMNMGPYTNVESLSLSFDALAPRDPTVRILNGEQGTDQQIAPAPGQRAPLSRQAAVAMRRVLPPDTAGLDTTQAALLARAVQTQNADAVAIQGELDVLRYGYVLRARRLVGLRGAGDSYDGNYYVKQVTHRINRGVFRQSFTLVREGRGATKPTVTL